MTEERAEAAKERIVEHALNERERIEKERIEAHKRIDAWGDGER